MKNKGFFYKPGDIFIYTKNFVDNNGIYKERKNLLVVIGTNFQGVIALPIVNKFYKHSKSLKVSINGNKKNKSDTKETYVLLKEIFTISTSFLNYRFGNLNKDSLNEILNNKLFFFSKGINRVSNDSFPKYSLNDLIKEKRNIIEEYKKIIKIEENEINIDIFTGDLIKKSLYMTSRKYEKSIEDIHNDGVVDYLRFGGYNIADQTRGGRSGAENSKGAGIIDIMVYDKTNYPSFIIEGMKLSSCGINNSTVISHIKKLIFDYDTLGNIRNYIIVYAEGKNFERLWKNYEKHINSHLNDFNGKRMIENTELYVDKSDVKTGINFYERNGKELELFHIFINMYSK